MLLQPITVQFSKSTLKPSVYTLRLSVALTFNTIRHARWSIVLIPRT